MTDNPRDAASRDRGADALRVDLEARGIDVLRLVYSDILGITRAKDLLVSQLGVTAKLEATFCEGVWVTTTHGDVLDGGGIMSSGLPDLVTRLDPATVTVMPWEPGVAYVLADAYDAGGQVNPLSPRAVLRSVIGQFEALSLRPVIGPELEFYIAQRGEDGWERAIRNTGFVYTAGAVVDPHGDLLHILRMVDRMKIGAFAANHEFSPSQYEINLWHGDALDAADRTFLFKTAVKDIVSRTGRLATFLGKPWNDEGGSGFHLHFSLVAADGSTSMCDADGTLTPLANQMIAGIVTHAPALVALANPTVNAFKRLGPDTLAPYRANWGYDNRSTMLRIPPERGLGTRLELRVGDGAANPYLIIAATLAAALDGIRNALDAPAPAEGWAYENTAAEVLPMTLGTALDALDTDTALRDILGAPLLDVFTTLKRDEVARYEQATPDPTTRDVTEWELEEYLEYY